MLLEIRLGKWHSCHFQIISTLWIDLSITTLAWGTKCSKLGIVSLVVLKQPSRCQGGVGVMSVVPSKIMSVHIPPYKHPGEDWPMSFMFLCNKEGLFLSFLCRHTLAMSFIQRYRGNSGIHWPCYVIWWPMMFLQGLRTEELSEGSSCTQQMGVVQSSWMSGTWCSLGVHDKAVKLCRLINTQIHTNTHSHVCPDTHNGTAY